MANSRLDAAYVAQIAAVRERVVSFTLARFAAGQHRDADLERFVSEVVPVVLASRRQVSSLTDAYLALVLTEALGVKVRPNGPVDTDSLRGVAAAEVYARPYVEVRTKLAEGLTYDQAISAGVARLADIALADMQLAKTHTAFRSFNRDGISGYKRTLTGRKNCALCYLASTQRYRKSELLPIHPGCNCGVQPLVEGDRDRMDEDLTATHEAVEERLGVSDAGGRAPDYRKQIIVREHGELGPVLTVKDQGFTGPKVVTKRQGLGFDAMTTDQLRNQRQTLAGLPDTEYSRKQLARIDARLSELGN